MINKVVDPAVREKWDFIRPLGNQGKDGLCVLARRKSDGLLAAFKLFKPKKSIRNIKKELKLQKMAADAGLSPAIIETAEISESHRCFAMEVMDKTLKSYLEEGNKLSDEMKSTIISIFQTLDNLFIFVNDDNVKNNIMIKDGKIFIIDFGMAKAIKRKGTRMTNLACLIKIRDLLAPKDEIIDEYEKKHGVILDTKKHAARARQKRIEDKLNELNISKK